MKRSADNSLTAEVKHPATKLQAAAAAMVPMIVLLVKVQAIPPIIPLIVNVPIKVAPGAALIVVPAGKNKVTVNIFPPRDVGATATVVALGPGTIALPVKVPLTLETGFVLLKVTVTLVPPPTADKVKLPKPARKAAHGSPEMVLRKAGSATVHVFRQRLLDKPVTVNTAKTVPLVKVKIAVNIETFPVGVAIRVTRWPDGSENTPVTLVNGDTLENVAVNVVPPGVPVRDVTTTLFWKRAQGSDFFLKCDFFVLDAFYNGWTWRFFFFQNKISFFFVKLRFNFQDESGVPKKNFRLDKKNEQYLHYQFRNSLGNSIFSRW